MTKHILETVGQVCPVPLVEAKRAIAEIPVGDELVIDEVRRMSTAYLETYAPTKRAR